MSHPYHHALSSAKRFGGDPADYQAIHDWFDASKELHGDFRHRALRHHTQGIFEAERMFGLTITNSRGARVPTRLIAEQHVIEDCGFLPTFADWVGRIAPEAWMNRPGAGRVHNQEPKHDQCHPAPPPDALSIPSHRQ